jgi:hypothetical protein
MTTKSERHRRLGLGDLVEVDRKDPLEIYGVHPEEPLTGTDMIFSVMPGSVGVITETYKTRWLRVLFPRAHGWAFATSLRRKSDA